ncbi:MAG: SDR family oxidoreductase [Chitinophagaceae bacterium]|nr:MAG: SDR family oxidoreductase [Chitinophagaceae bacterium]
MKIAITGATGQLGRLVINKLKEKIPTDNMIALSRSVEKAKGLEVEVREFDYEKPAMLKPALKGVDTLLLISASEIGKRFSQHKHIIEAAKSAGIKWIVYTSLLRTDNTSLDIGAEHKVTEKLLKESGIPFTILRNGWYTENYTSSVPGAIRGGALMGCAGNGKISGAARADYADAAAAVLTGKNHQGKIYELAGDNFFTLSDLAAEISRQTGKNIPYKNLSEKDYTSALKNFGVPEEFAKVIAGWDTAASKNDLFDDSHQLSRLTGNATTPLSVSVANAIKG